MLRPILNRRHLFMALFVLLVVCTHTATAQSTGFVYEGRLDDNNQPANGNYDFEFKLFDALTGGNQDGTPRQVLNVAVNNGTFTVLLDFGAGAFPGADRFLEIGFRPAGGGTFTLLTPRQQITPTPYAIKSASATSADFATNAINAQNAVNAETAQTATNATNATNATTAQNALQLGGVAANQYVRTNDSRLSDARNPLPGSLNYIHNTNALKLGNFNITGSGTVGGTLTGNIVNATTQYNIGGDRILSNAGIFNLFAGVGAGTANTSGFANSFFGNTAGADNTNGNSNSFFGFGAGNANLSGNSNSFFGVNAGALNRNASNNSFFGGNAGRSNISGSDNAFFGFDAGRSNTASGNSFFGTSAGLTNTTGDRNAFFGKNAGLANTSGSDNTFFGADAGKSNTSRGNNSFFGSQAGFNNMDLGRENSFFGAKAGFSNTTGFNNDFFGYNAGLSNTTGNFNSFFGAFAGRNNETGNFNSFFGDGAGYSNETGEGNSFFGDSAGRDNREGGKNTLIGYRANVSRDNLYYATAIGADATVDSSSLIVLGRSNGLDNVRVPGKLIVRQVEITSALVVNQLGPNSGGTEKLCRNTVNEISYCSSSLRYKTDIAPFSLGLNLANRLRPISFTWKDGGMRDLGLGAEDVEKVEPLLVTYNDKGEVEGVKYDRVAVVLLNAVKEQQETINAQRQRVEQQEQRFNQQEETIKSQQRQLAAQQEMLRRQQREINSLKQIVLQGRPNARARR